MNRYLTREETKETKDIYIRELVKFLSETKSVPLDDRLFLKDLLKDGILNSF